MGCFPGHVRPLASALIRTVRVIGQESAWNLPEVAVVAQVFASYLEEGQSLKRVTKPLMEQQIPTPSGRGRWNQATIRGSLTHPVYTGTVYLGRSRPVQAQQRHSA